MYKPTVKYDLDRINKLWNCVAYCDCREYAFFDGFKWHHPKQMFGSCDELMKFICLHNVSEIHVKPVRDSHGHLSREWVIDVDFVETDSDMLALKVAVARETFQNFFGDSVARMMHTGNRGIHVWLRIDRFRMDADSQTRGKYYKTFVKPQTIVLDKIQPGSFINCIKSAIESENIQQMVKNVTVYKSNGVPDIKTLINTLWPPVDQHVFCNLVQIRAPFSYHHKGKKYSSQLA
ncbi:lef-1 [Sucra jujuba nucleopolyhedrovirus]|uniref:Lef-1 n=1 Tax=Sucra jujuba nucleopolyhedrovirus TaxID=1563660 RepID=A0A097P952_9ABAC|nr:lef-1 [Sucra jujuba nucleopolyhedrovirus]AIU41360.1 lef-1 [Sucra jujuba nucleopolyhedrovirus]